MTEREVQAADIIIENSTLFGTNSLQVLDLFEDYVNREDARTDMKNAALYLEGDGLLKIELYHGMHMKYILTPKGQDLKSKGKNYTVYSQEKESRSERDDRHKDLQILDLEMKIDTMNKEQLMFWNRQRWQFWLTLMVAGAAFILSVINFVKSIVL